MEISSVGSLYPRVSQEVKGSRGVDTTLRDTPVGVEILTHTAVLQVDDVEKLRKRTAEALAEIQKFNEFYDTKLQFSVNKDIDRVIVKVVDSSTNKVIKEIPTKEVQRLQTRLREALGLLFDEFV